MEADIELEGCALRCLQETNFDCRSFDYGSSFRCCYLSAQDRTTQASSYQVTSGQDYYHYLPGNRWRDDGRCGSSWAADLASPAECDPYGDYCCSGTRCQQGTCTSGTDYRGWDRYGERGGWDRCGERVCSCTSHSRTMTCSGRTIRELDFFIPRNTRNLDLSSNVLTSVPVSALARLTELQTLTLRSNRIGSLPFDVFEDLNSVQTINLQNNQFSELDLGQFMDLPTLRNLYVDAGTDLKFTWGYLPEVYPNHGVSCPFNDCYSPCGDPHYLNGPEDWSRLQRDLVIKKLYFDLADLFYLVSDATQSVTIYAHTVVASAGVSFDFDLTIHTQMFWTGTNADLTFNLPSGHHHGPIITCGTLDDSFQQININVGDRLKINIVTNESFAMPYPCGDTRSTALSLQADSDQMAITVQCARLLAQDFNLADLRSQPMRMVDWVISQGRAAGDPVHSEAVTIKYELMVTARGARYVPYLAQSVYFSMLDDYYREVSLFVCLFVCLFVRADGNFQGCPVRPLPGAVRLLQHAGRLLQRGEFVCLFVCLFVRADGNFQGCPVRPLPGAVRLLQHAGRLLQGARYVPYLAQSVYFSMLDDYYRELMVTARGARYVPYLAQSVYCSMLDDYYRELMVTARGARYVPYLAQSVYFSMLDDYYRELMVTARGARYVPYLAQSVYFSMLDDYYRELMVTSRGARYVPYLAQSVYFSMLDDYYRELLVTARGARYVPYLAQSVYFSMLDDYYRELMVTSRGARYVPYLAQSVYFSMLDDYYRELLVTARGARYVPYLAQSVYFSMLDDYYREFVRV
ncbi:uncharacterized protein LOC118430832 [Branchiostoma floridae]|uniref:Uncharacterized protein LOC118430832 n=1 Tax=Branchiostoma floridae TaxID=7739 RepID=A0A9J7N9C8_BRAFL|nr:uncharacterized protein LOC118430832 [Branchiostoma floridae]